MAFCPFCPLPRARVVNISERFLRVLLPLLAAGPRQSCGAALRPARLPLSAGCAVADVVFVSRGRCSPSRPWGFGPVVRCTARACGAGAGVGANAPMGV